MPLQLAASRILVACAAVRAGQTRTFAASAQHHPVAREATVGLEVDARHQVRRFKPMRGKNRAVVRGSEHPPFIDRGGQATGLFVALLPWHPILITGLVGVAMNAACSLKRLARWSRTSASGWRATSRPERQVGDLQVYAAHLPPRRLRRRRCRNSVPARVRPLRRNEDQSSA